MGSIILPLSSSTKSLLEKATAAYEANVELAGEWLQGRGIDLASAERFRLGVVTTPEQIHQFDSRIVGRLAIPSIGINGVVSIRFRCLIDHDCKAERCPKYLGIKGEEARLWNPQALFTEERYVGVSEGEIDGISLEIAGIPAIGLPGANAWRDHYSILLDGFDDVYACGDGDNAGQEMNLEVRTSVPHASIVTIGHGLDINQVLVTQGVAGVRRLVLGEEVAGDSTGESLSSELPLVQPGQIQDRERPGL